MHAAVKWAEVAPALPLLPALAETGGYFLAWGILCLITLWVALLVYVIQQTVGRIPGIGGAISAGARRLEQYTSNKLAGPIASLDHRMGQAWFRLAGLTKWMAHEIMANAALLGNITGLLANPFSLPAWQSVLHGVTKLVADAKSGVAVRVHTALAPVDARVARLDRWTHAQITALRHSIAVTLPHEIAGLRHRTRTIEDSITDAWKLLKKHERLLGIGAMTGVVAVALSRLGLGWARCTKVNRVGKQLCGLDDSLLNALLADALIVAGSLSLVELGKELQPIVGTSARVVQNFWRVG